MIGQMRTPERFLLMEGYGLFPTWLVAGPWFALSD